jgi:acyl-CoA synthetase (AMP-forming)/AMP-acid ligase II
LLTDYVLARAAERGDKPAVLEAVSGRLVTYQQLPGRIGEMAAILHGYGVQAGSVVAVRMPNGPELPIAHHAILSLGATVLSLNALATETETTAAMAQADVCCLVTGSRVPQIQCAVQRAGACGAKDVAMMFMSSGTTGQPKAVGLPHRSLTGALARLEGVYRIGPGDIVFCAVALSHVYGAQSALHPALRAGATLLTLDRFDLDQMVDSIGQYHATMAFVVPTIVHRLLQHPCRDALASLHTIVSAGAPLGAALTQECARTLGVRVVENYGLTEAGGCTHITPDQTAGRPGSIGLPAPGVRCRLIRPGTGQPASPGQPGELWMSCGDFPDTDWLQTGDLVRQDEDGFYYVVGRLKELIKCNGYQVAPAELEAILQQHPAVADAAVIGVPDDRYGEVPKAFVVAAGQVTSQQLTDYVSEQVAPYKKVRSVEFIAALPRNTAGKILRTSLAGRATEPVTLITGGSRGFGRAVALELAERGLPVAITARDAAQLAETIAELRQFRGDVLAVPADLTQPGAFQAVFNQVEAQLGTVDSLINNAGVQGPVGEQWQTDPDEWWHTITINLRAAALACAAVLPVMTRRGSGRIINIVSHAGVERWPHLSAYSVSKAALIKLTENLAAETRRYGVSVLSYHPGLLEIGLGQTQLATSAAPGSWSAKVSDWLRQQKVAGNLTLTSDAVAALAHLVEGKADHLSGSYLTVDDLQAMIGQPQTMAEDATAGALSST